MSDAAEEPTAVMITIRLMPMGKSTGEPEEHNVKVLLRSTISHVVRTAFASFPGYFIEDFAAYLVRPNQEIGMDASKQLQAYGIRCYDVIELRQKQIPITLYLDVHEEEARAMKVNSSLPVYAVVKVFCKALKIKHSKELSLALPPKQKARVSIARMEWLDATQSLNSQGIKNGDTVLLRKKFFIFNEDVREAEHNPILRELLYGQLQQQLQCTNPPVRRKRLSSQGPLASSPQHTSASANGDVQAPAPIDQEEAIPLPTSTILAEVMEALSSSDSKSNVDQQYDIVNTLSRHQISQFEVKTPDCDDTFYMCIQSESVCLLNTPKFSSKSEFAYRWPLRQISKCEAFDNGVKLVMDDGEPGVLFSKEADELASYIKQAISIMMDKEDNSSPESSAANSPENQTKLPHSHSPTPEQESRDKRSPTPSPPPEYAEAMAESTPMKKPISLSLSVSSFASSNSSERSASAPFEEARANGAEVFSGLDPSVAAPFSSQEDPSLVEKKENLSEVHPPSYFGLDYRDILNQYALVHFIILDQDIRPLLVNIHCPVSEVIKEVCETFGIPYPKEHLLKLPKSVEDLFKRYGGKPTVIFGKTFKPMERDRDFRAELLPDSSLSEQIHFEISPCVLSLKRRNFEGVDAVERFNLEIGTEWPGSEDPGVARYRLFFQSWAGIVQGIYPVDKKTAIKLAALLVLVYHGYRNAHSWKLANIDYKALLPKEFHATISESDVLKAHSECGKMELNEAIDAVIKLCDETPGACGLTFDIKVPSQTELFSMITRNKMEPQKLCVSRKGFVCLNRNRKVCLQQDFSALNTWGSSQGNFYLNFQGEAQDCHGLTYQSHQLLEMMEVYVKSTYRDYKDATPEKKDLGGASVTDV